MIGDKVPQSVMLSAKTDGPCALAAQHGTRVARNRAGKIMAADDATAGQTRWLCLAVARPGGTPASMAVVLPYSRAARQHVTEVVCLWAHLGNQLAGEERPTTGRYQQRVRCGHSAHTVLRRANSMLHPAIQEAGLSYRRSLLCDGAATVNLNRVRALHNSACADNKASKGSGPKLIFVRNNVMVAEGSGTCRVSLASFAPNLPQR